MKPTCALCDRPSCRPEQYAPLCARHYILSVQQAEKDAQARFHEHMDELSSTKALAVIKLEDHRFGKEHDGMRYCMDRGCNTGIPAWEYELRKPPPPKPLPDGTILAEF